MNMKSFLATAAIAPLPLVGCFVLLCIKHVVADFVLQPHAMAVAKERAQGWFWPLLGHCMIHGACATLVVLAWRPALWPLGVADFGVHFVVDRSKGYLNSRFRLTQDDGSYWTLLGIDQTLHHLTGFAIALIVVAQMR